jgi:hypothetical protein
MAYLSGFFSKFNKIILLTLNIVLFIVGLLVTILGLVLKYDKKFKELISFKELEKILDIGQINTITIMVISIGAFVMILSLLGVAGLVFLSKFLLITYQVIIIILFLAHGIGLLVYVFDRSTIEKGIKTGINKVVTNLNTEANNTNSYKTDCDIMKALSSLFTCCGSDSPNDFKNNTDAITNCCSTKSPEVQTGCSSKIINSIQENAKIYLIIPSCIILAVELIVIVMTPVITKHIRSSEKNYSMQNYNFKNTK